jgi:Fibronectin type III domain
MMLDATTFLRRAVAGATAFVFSTTVLAVGAVPSVAAPAAAVAAAGAAGAPFVAVKHRQVLHAKVKAGTLTSFTVRGVPTTGVSAVVLSVSVTSATVTGALTAFEYGTKRPRVVSVSLTAGRTASSLVVVAVNGTEKASIYNASSKTEPVLATVVGYDAAPGTLTATRARTGFVPVTPRRLASVSLPPHAGTSLSFPTPAGLADTDVAGVVLSLTAAAPTRSGALVAYPTGTRAPSPTSVTFTAQRNNTALVIVAPGPRGRFTVASRSAGRVRVWADVVGYLRTLRISTAPRAVSATAQNEGALIAWSPPANDGGAPITAYTVVTFPSGARVVTDGSAAAASIGSLRDGTPYTFTVVATNAVGTSITSDPSAPITPVSPPPPPTGVSATASGPGQVTVAWAPSPDNRATAAITGYRIAGTPGGDASVGDVSSAFVTGLTPGQVYSFTVSATTATGDSLPSLASNPATAGGTSRASVGLNEVQGDNLSAGGEAVSADGRYVAFQSSADNLVPGDANGMSDVFLRDRLTDTTTLVSVAAAGGGSGNSQSFIPSISADGRYVLFESQASNLVVPATTVARLNIFLRDMTTGVTTLLSAVGGVEANANSFDAVISADGSTVAFSSAATNLVTPDTNAASDVFIENVASRTVQRVSESTGGVQADQDSTQATLSADGRYVTTVSAADNLVTAPPSSGFYQVYVHDMVVGSTTMVSVGDPIGAGNGSSSNPSISGDGRFVAWDSDATNLVAGDTNGVRDVFVRDLRSGTTTRVSVAADGFQGDDPSALPSMSTNGRYLAFSSQATTLVPGDLNGFADVLRLDRQTGLLQLVSRATNGIQGNDYSANATISEDGQHIVYESAATNLVAGDTNAFQDIFVADLG